MLMALIVSAAGATLAAQVPEAPARPAPPPGAFRQSPDSVVTRATIGAAGARRMIDAAVALATRNGWTASIAVVDAGGNLLAFQRMDGATLGTIDVARRKAATALSLGLPTAALNAMVQRGGPAMLTLGTDVVAVTGGSPVLAGGQVIGAVGISGGFKGEDDVLVAAALATVASANK